MSDQTHYPPVAPYDISRNAGIMYVDELGPDGTPFWLKLYYVPPEALSLVKPTQVVGISIRELHDASPEVQCLVLEAWFRLNHQPAAPHVYAQYRKNFFSPQIVVGSCFTAPELDGLREGLLRLWPKLASEARIWLQKPPEPRDALRESALRALDGLEAAIRQGDPGMPGIGHNQLRKPSDDTPETLDDGRRDALVAIEDSRRELHAERPNFEVLHRSAQTILKLAQMAGGVVWQAMRFGGKLVGAAALGYAAHIGTLAATKGPDAAIANVAILRDRSVEAAMKLQALVSGPNPPVSFPRSPPSPAHPATPTQPPGPT